MPRTAREVPPPLELLCLSALWTLEEGDVKAVREMVAQSRPLAYTTIMTVLDRLVRKGMLARRKVGRRFVYAPQATRDAARRRGWPAVRTRTGAPPCGAPASLCAPTGPAPS